MFDGAFRSGRPSRAEVWVVLVVLVLAHLMMLVGYAPAPHGDASAYVEPALLLASEGLLAGPATQHQDLMYTVGFYSYPPGYFLSLAAWVRGFGPSPVSLLAFTHACHLILTGAVWYLVRFRFRGTPLSAVLAVAVIFPLFHHGRPDVTSLCLAALAWVVLPDQGFGWRLTAAGLLLGAAVLTSPGYGSSSAASVGAYCLLSGEASRPRRAARFAVLTAAAVLAFAATVVAVLAQQHAWTVAEWQWANHLAVRGTELNRVPPLANTYGILFCVIPLGAATLLPAVVVSLLPVARTGPQVRAVALCLLAGVLVWFLTSKSFLLYIGHFGLLGRPVFYGLLLSAPDRRLRAAGFAAAGVVILTHFHFEKEDYVPLIEDPRPAVDAARDLAPPSGVVAVDSMFFPVIYRPHETISYEIFQSLNRWQEYRDRTPPEVRERFAAYRTGPLNPDVVIISTAALVRWGPPDPTAYRPIGAEPQVQYRRLLGLRLPILTDPYRPVVFVRRDESR